MSKYSGFTLVNRNNLGPSFFVGCHRMSKNVALHKFHCISVHVQISLVTHTSYHDYRQTFNLLVGRTFKYRQLTQYLFTCNLHKWCKDVGCSGLW